MNNNILLNFLYKFLCIFKAASKGWIVSYIGNNQFSFYKHNTKKTIQHILKNYTNTLPNILKYK